MAQYNHAFTGAKAKLEKILKKTPGVVDALSKDRHASLLYTAARAGNTDIVEMLVDDFGADVNRKNGGENKSTPLHGAAYGGHTDIVKFLCDEGAVCSTNEFDETPQDNAKEGEGSAATKKKIIKLLDAAGSKKANASKKRKAAASSSSSSSDDDDGAPAETSRGSKKKTKKGDDAAWEWLDDAGLWVPFYPEDNDLIEDGYTGTKGKFVTKDLSFNKNFGSMYEFNFKKMTQTNQESGTSRKLRRSSSADKKEADKAYKAKGYGVSGKAAPKPAASSFAAGMAFPETWTEQEDPDLDMVPVDEDSEEWDTVLAPFLKTLNRKCKLHSLTRIQNYKLWPFYALKRMALEAKNKAKKGPGAKDAKEVNLFHGARQKDNMDAITRFGFDMRVAANGMYGIGIYFATNANYSDGGYVLQHKDGSKEMYICRVLLGRGCAGKHGLRRPPPVKASEPKGELFDSVWGGAANAPIMHIVFDNALAIPEYIVHYK